MTTRTLNAPSHHLDFLNSIANREAESRTAKGPAPLSVQEHASHRSELKDVRFIKPKYADNTEINISGVFGKWKRYCSTMEVGEWRASIERLTREMTMDFFLFVCEESKGRIKSWGTTRVYIREFQELYTTVTGRYVDRNDMKELYKYHDHILIPRFGLRAPNIDGKPVINVDSLKVILVFNLAYDTTPLPGRHRLQLCGIYQVLCYTGVRPAELVDGERKKPKDGSDKVLFSVKAVMTSGHGPGEASAQENRIDNEDDDEEAQDEQSIKLSRLLLKETIGRDRPKALCYEDIFMMLVRHPVTGRTIPAMAIKFIHHKGADNKPKPTIFHFTPTKKLIFDFVLIILSLALHDDAFDADGVRDANSLLRGEIPSWRASEPVRWKRSKLKVPVFRRMRHGTLSNELAMLYSKLNEDMGRQSLDAGFEKRWTPRFARRAAANTANGNAPDAVRDQMMRHNPEFYTFQDAYLNEIANFDLQNAFLEEEMEDQLFRLFAHVSLTRDPRATRDMVPPEVWANLPPDPEIVKLEQQRENLKQGRFRYQGQENEAQISTLTDTIRTKRLVRERKIVKEYREYYFYHSPTWDLEKRARGDELEEWTEPPIHSVIPERTRLAEMLCHQPQNLSHEADLELRIEAVHTMVALCDKKEPRKRNPTPQKNQIELSSALRLQTAVIKPEVKPEPDMYSIILETYQCPDCIGDERLPPEARTYKYARLENMNDHFDSQHLPGRIEAEHRGEAQRCNNPKCMGQTFLTLDHFRSHTAKVHTASLRSSEQVENRQQKAKARRVKKIEYRQIAKK